MYLGRAAPGVFPSGDQYCREGGAAAGAWHRPQKRLRIIQARRTQNLGLAELKRIGVVVKRAQYFITCKGRAAAHANRAEIANALLDPKAFSVGMQQLSLDDFVPKALPDAAPAVQKLAARGMAADEAAKTVRQEALQCLTKRM